MTLDELLCLQTGWHWCGKCQGLFFAGTNPFASTGRCPQGDFHDDSAAGHPLDVLGHRDVEQNPDEGRCPGDDLYLWL